MTFASPLPSVSLPALPLTPYIFERAGGVADKAAFIDGVTGRTVTYSEFEDAVRRQAGGWLERGLTKGEVVAVMAANTPEGKKFGFVFLDCKIIADSVANKVYLGRPWRGWSCLPG